MQRILRALATAAVAVLAVPTVATAQTPATFSSTAEATGVSLTLPGAGTFSGAITAATISEAPNASASGTGFAGAPGSASSAETSSGSVRSPEAGQNCATPAVPGVLAGLSLGLACSTALANVPTAGTTPIASATSTGNLGELGVDGSIVAETIVDAIVAPVTGQLGGALDTVEGAVIDPALTAAAEQCNAIIGEVNNNIPAPLDDALGQLTGGINDATPDQLQDVIDQVPGSDNPCEIFAELSTLPPAIADLVVNDLVAALRNALAGVELLTVSLGQSTSTVSAQDDGSGRTVGSDSAFAGFAISSLSLDFLLPVLQGLLDDVAQPFLDELNAIIAPLDPLPPIPNASSVVGQVVDELDVPILTDSTPILSVAAAPSRAQATYDATLDVTNVSGEAGQLTIVLSEAFAALLGEGNNTFTVSEGGAQTLFADTPLESSFAVGTVTEEANGIRVSGLDVTLVSGADGGIVLSAGDVRSVSAGQPGTLPAGAPPLPTTGGGAALLGLGLLGAATALGRRRTS